MKPIKMFLFATFLLLARANARADLLFTLDSILKGGDPGSEIVFTGTLANTDNSALFLNSIQFNFDSPVIPYLTGDANVFLNNAPVSLASAGSAGDTYTGPIFGVNVDSTTPPGIYIGSVTLTGGADGNATDILATQNFGAVIPMAVPEAPTLFGLSLGLLLLGGAALRLHSKIQSRTGIV